MIMLHPLAARVEKPVGILWSGLFAIKPPSHLSNTVYQFDATGQQRLDGSALENSLGKV